MPREEGRQRQRVKYPASSFINRWWLNNFLYAFRSILRGSSVRICDCLKESRQPARIRRRHGRIHRAHSDVWNSSKHGCGIGICSRGDGGSRRSRWSGQKYVRDQRGEDFGLGHHSGTEGSLDYFHLPFGEGRNGHASWRRIWRLEVAEECDVSFRISDIGIRRSRRNVRTHLF